MAIHLNQLTCDRIATVVFLLSLAAIVTELVFFRDTAPSLLLKIGCPMFLLSSVYLRLSESLTRR